MEYSGNLEEDFARVCRWVAGYYAHPETYRVLPNVRPGEIAARLPAEAPERGESFEQIFDDFERIVVPGSTHWNHPRFFAYFATSAAPVAVMAETLAATLDAKAMLWRTSPAATELETVTMRWLGQLLGLPDSWTGIIYDTASVAGFTALTAAREALGLDIRRRGMAGRALPRLTVYVTEHTHSHIEKAAIALGVGQENVVRVSCDAEFRMRPDALQKRLADDVRAGIRPLAVVATVGTTSTTAIDPVAAIARVCRESGTWLHVDAAYAGMAAVVPEHRAILDGVERADSLVVNPHKWMFVPMDLSVLFLKDEATVRRAFSLTPEYLTTPEDGTVSYMDYGLQLGRRFRALKLWFVLRHFGAEGIRAKLRAHVELAQSFASWVRADPNWEVLAPHPLSVVCFRYRGAEEATLDAFNERLMHALNATGELFISHTRIDGAFALRLAIGNLRTQRRDVELAWQLARREGALLAGS
ncbi:MAG TPA: pyridoxal-dependent decarboxylase [Candidatus Tumulicola sp.]